MSPSEMLEVGDRVAVDDYDRRGRVIVRLGTIKDIRPGCFDIMWDDTPRLSRGWLRFALRKIPHGSARVFGGSEPDAP